MARSAPILPAWAGNVGYRICSGGPAAELSNSACCQQPKQPVLPVSKQGADTKCEHQPGATLPVQWPHACPAIHSLVFVWCSTVLLGLSSLALPACRLHRHIHHPVQHLPSCSVLVFSRLCLHSTTCISQQMWVCRSHTWSSSRGRRLRLIWWCLAWAHGLPWSCTRASWTPSVTSQAASRWGKALLYLRPATAVL